MSKKQFLLTIVLMLALSACVPGLTVPASNPPAPTQTPYVQVVTATSAPTQAPTQTPEPAQPTENYGTGGGNEPTQQAPVSGTCPQARDLGPWAPSASGEGQTFEVTASDQGASNLSSAGVVLGLWWPAGTKDYGVEEVTTFVPRGLSITVIAGAGRGWDYESSCPADVVQAEMKAHEDARTNDTSYFGYVAVEDLIAKGLVEVRFDRRGQNPEAVSNKPTAQPTAQPTTAAPKATTAPSGTGGSAVCKATRAGDSDNMANVTAKSNETLSVEAWGNGVDGFVVVPSGQTIARTWTGGAVWSYSCSNTAAVLADVSNRGKKVMLVENGKLVQQ